MRAPGFGVGALQENCGVYGLDDALAYWTNARCAGQAYVQHRYCTVFARENKDMIFDKLEEDTVFELFGSVHFPTAGCPGLGGVTGTGQSVDWGTALKSKWCENPPNPGDHDSETCKGNIICANAQSLYPWPEIASSSNLIVMKQCLGLIAFVLLLGDVVIDLVLPARAYCTAPKVRPSK
jgi:hypothetical protein